MNQLLKKLISSLTKHKPTIEELVSEGLPNDEIDEFLAMYSIQKEEDQIDCEGDLFLDAIVNYDLRNIGIGSLYLYHRKSILEGRPLSALPDSFLFGGMDVYHLIYNRKDKTILVKDHELIENEICLNETNLFFDAIADILDYNHRINISFNVFVEHMKQVYSGVSDVFLQELVYDQSLDELD